MSEICGCKPDVVTYNTMISGFCKAGSLDEAVSLLDEMVKQKPAVIPTFVTYTALIDHLCKADNRLEQAYQIFERMAEGACVCTVAAYCNLFDGLQRAGKLMEASHVYRDMCRKNVRLEDRTYSVLIHGLSKMDGGGVEAHKLICEMIDRGITPNRVTFNVFLNKLCKEGGADEAIKLFRVMRKTEFQPDLYSYNTVIDGLCKTERLAEAQQLYQEMKSSNINPSLVTYSTLVEGLYRNNYLKEALELVRLMLDRGFTPRVATLSKLLHTLVQRKRMDEALELYKSVTNEGVVASSDGESFDLLLFPHCVNSNRDDAKTLFESAIAKGLVPTTASCNVLLDTLCKEEKFGEAKKLFSKIKVWCKPDLWTYNIMIRGLCLSKEIDEAYCLFKEMIDEGLEANSWTYNFMISGFIKTEAWTSAKMLFERMKAGKNQGAPSPNIVTYEILISGFCSAGEMNAACKLFGVMHDKGLVPSSRLWEMLLSKLSQAGRVEEAIELYKELARANPNLHHHVKSCNSLLNGLLRTGNVDRAVAFIDEMIEGGISPNRITYTTLVTGLCSQGMIDHAHRLIVEMVRQMKRPDNSALRTMLNGFCERRDYAAAYEFYSWLPSVGIELTLSMHNILVQYLCAGKSLEYLERIAQRQGIPDVILARIEKFKREYLGEEEVKIYEAVRDRKIRRTMAYIEPRRPVLDSSYRPHNREVHFY